LRVPDGAAVEPVVEVLAVLEHPATMPMSAIAESAASPRRAARPCRNFDVAMMITPVLRGTETFR
jgi:hypothetical protein